MTGDMVLYALIGAALVGSVVGVFFDKLLVALLAPIPIVVVPMGILVAVRPYLERDPDLPEDVGGVLAQLANTTVLIQMTLACAGGVLLAGLLVRLAAVGQTRTPKPRRVPVKKRVAAVEQSRLQSRTNRLAAAPPLPAAPKPPPIFEVEPILAGGIRASSVADIVREGEQPDAAANRRARGRRRAILSGFLMMDDNRSTACRIVDVSDTGAKVRLPTLMALPERLWLLNTSDWMAYEAVVAWHRDADAGLRFLSKRNLRNPVTERDHALHALCVSLTPR